MTTTQPLRAALYARVSTRDQSAAAQLDRLHEYAERQGWEASAFVDEGVSGAKAARPALDAMVEAIHRREVDAVVAVKLDRLGRSVRHLCQLAEQVEAAGVRLVVLDQAIDTSTATGRLLFNVLASVAEFERELIRERVAAGLERAKRRGRKLGRPAALGVREVARARRLREHGHSLRAIASRLGVDKRTVGRVLAAT